MGQSSDSSIIYSEQLSGQVLSIETRSPFSQQHGSRLTPKNPATAEPLGFCDMLHDLDFTTEAGTQPELEEHFDREADVARSAHSRRLAIVGNGPISVEQRAEIDTADSVIRLNGMSNW